MIIKTIEISSTFGGVIAEAPFENAKPSFTDKLIIDLEKGDNEQEIRDRFRGILQEDQFRAFELLKNKLRAALIEKEHKKIRFREKGGKKYPSVTSIIGWSKDFFISENELNQYAARGTIIHYMIEQFIKTGAWLTLKEVAENGHRENAAIMFRGSKGLRTEDCTHEAFFEAFGKDFEIEEMEVEVYNEEHLYSGRFDAIGDYKGVRSLIDFKTGSLFEMKQLAAYAKADGVEGIEQLVICPVGPNTNKSGVKNPVVTKNINTEFEYFLKDRAKFFEHFGI